MLCNTGFVTSNHCINVSSIIYEFVDWRLAIWICAQVFVLSEVRRRVKVV